jgi:hypothetical protein
MKNDPRAEQYFQRSWVLPPTPLPLFILVFHSLAWANETKWSSSPGQLFNEVK